MKTFFAFVLFSVVAVFPMLGRAVCIQGHPSVKTEYAESEWVVIGSVKGERYVRDPEDPDGHAAVIYRVLVDQTFRGNARSTLDIYSVNTSARFPMIKGSRYLLFVRDGHEGLWVNACGNSGFVAERKQELSAVAAMKSKKK